MESVMMQCHVCTVAQKGQTKLALAKAIQVLQQAGHSMEFQFS